jgi:hypothetical protein
VDDAGEEVLSYFRFGAQDTAALVPGMGPFEAHHAIPKYVQTKLQKCLNKVGQWDLDEVPTVLETRPNHWFPNGLHAHISGNGLHWNVVSRMENNAETARTILDQLQKAYQDANRHDLVKVVIEWRQTIE